MSKDMFTATQFAWQRQLVADHRLPGSALRVALVVADHMNRKTGDAWPGQGRIAELCGLSRTGVRKAISMLEERGHLLVEAGRGRRLTSRYRWKLDNQETARNDHTSDPFSEENGNQSDPLSKTEKGHSCAKKGHSCIEKGHPSCHKPTEEPIEEPTEVDTPIIPQSFFEDFSDAETDPPPDRFEEFWDQYPRRVAKGAARGAWRKAAKTADPGEIIRGAMRYAAEREGQEARFTKHPATWLKAECWADDPAPATNVVPLHNGHHQPAQSGGGWVADAARAAAAIMAAEGQT